MNATAPEHVPSPPLGEPQSPKGVMRGPVLLALESADASACVAMNRAHALSVVVNDALHVVRRATGSVLVAPLS